MTKQSIDPQESPMCDSCGKYKSVCSVYAVVVYDPHYNNETYDGTKRLCEHCGIEFCATLTESKED